MKKKRNRKRRMKILQSIRTRRFMRNAIRKARKRKPHRSKGKAKKAGVGVKKYAQTAAAKPMKKMKIKQPDMHVVIDYNTVFDNYNSTNPVDLISGIPSILLLHNMVMLYKRVEYALSDLDEQQKMIKEMAQCMNVVEKSKIRSFCIRNKAILLTWDTLSLFLRLVLSNYEEVKGDETSLNLSPADEKRFYQAILYCNQVWTDKQLEHMKSTPDWTELALKMDLPIIEFKFHKDFRTQFYKAGLFFKYSEQTPPYNSYLQQFIKDVGVANWQEYLLKLFSMIDATIKAKYVDFNDKDIDFFLRFVVDFNDAKVKYLWTDQLFGLKYLRDHFMVHLPNNRILLLDGNCLVDKMYQGMLFDFHSSAKNVTKKVGSFLDFKSKLGEKFSEPHLFYPLISHIFSGRADAMFSGDELKAAGVIGEPDYYVRQGKVLYLFEFKDVLLSDNAKYSNDVDIMKEALEDKICCNKIGDNGKPKVKGFGQLIEVANDIVNNKLYDRLDADASKVTDIAPIVVTTDTAFNANGVNASLIQPFETLMKKYKFELFILKPLVLDYDTLVKLSYHLHIGSYSFIDVIRQYVMTAHVDSSFKAFVDDSKFGRINITKEENKFLFEGIIPMD